MMIIKYVLNGFEVGTLKNATAVPRRGDKISLAGRIYTIKDIIWHIEHTGICIEVLL